MFLVQVNHIKVGYQLFLNISRLQIVIFNFPKSCDDKTRTLRYLFQSAPYRNSKDHVTITVKYKRGFMMQKKCYANHFFTVAVMETKTDLKPRKAV